MTGEIDELQRWFESQCDGDWEHDAGVRIETLDNPGWHVEIGLAGTDLEGHRFAPIEDLGPGRTWLTCRVTEEKWVGDGGAPMLGAILRVFLDWARAEHGQPSGSAG